MQNQGAGTRGAMAMRGMSVMHIMGMRIALRAVPV